MNTTHLMITALISLVSVTAARADGFICTGTTTGIKITVYNNTQPSRGTRTPEIMVVSDPSQGPKTIATFKKEEGTLIYQGYGTYKATVTDALTHGEQGEKILGGAHLKELKTIVLNANFSYSSLDSQTSRDADHLAATFDYNKNTGDTLTEDSTCKRYTKR